MIRAEPSSLAQLVARARAKHDDDAGWLLVADALTAAKNPLGEYIALTIRGGSSARMTTLARAWRRRYAPWARIFAWWRIGLVLTMRDLDSVFANIDGIRAIGIPVIVEITRGSDQPDVCTFDDAFTRIAWTRKDQTIENASWGPGLGEDRYEWRNVVVFRVVDRAEVFARSGIEADWIAVEFRGDGLYAIGGEDCIVSDLNAFDEVVRALSEAVSAPGRKVQVWSDEVKDGKRLLMIYRLGDHGAQQLAWRNVLDVDRGALAAHLGGRGIAIGGYDFFCDFVWVKSAAGVEVFDSKRKVLDATGERATLEDGRVIPRADFARVVAFAMDDYIYRGVKAALVSGKEVPLVTEASGSAMGDPTYSRNELLCETVWASTLGSAIAEWAGVEFADLI